MLQEKARDTFAEPEKPETRSPNGIRYYFRAGRGKLRHGMWIYDREGRTEFFHGDKDEQQNSYYREETLVSPPGFAFEVSEEEALQNLENWPEAHALLFKTIERYNKEMASKKGTDL